MARTPTVVSALVTDLDDDIWRWKPASGGWSILEVICHLGDEEVDDFRTRVQMTLEDAAQSWPGIDPEGWAEQRAYNQSDPAAALARFIDERAQSLGWLRSLRNPDWSAAHQHPKIGLVRAGDLLASWAAHDALHLRQIIKRLYEMTQRDAGDFRTDYAGRWTA